MQKREERGERREEREERREERVFVLELGFGESLSEAVSPLSSFPSSPLPNVIQFQRESAYFEWKHNKK
jgi:hypothetical protein